MKKLLLTGHQGFIGKNIKNFLDDHNESFDVHTVEKEFYLSKNWEIAIEEFINSVDFVLHVGADSNTLNKDIENATQWVKDAVELRTVDKNIEHQVGDIT